MILYDDFPGKPVNIHASSAKNVNPMMSIQYSSIRPRFQGTFRPGH
ncbi:MAG: hypothetical protein ABR921_14595 [Candidatus Sulfotelmatobacter sp.]